MIFKHTYESFNSGYAHSGFHSWQWHGFAWLFWAWWDKSTVFFPFANIGFRILGHTIEVYYHEAR
jgi:hypothetical protein